MKYVVVKKWKPCEIYRRKCSVSKVARFCQKCQQIGCYGFTRAGLSQKDNIWSVNTPTLQ